MAAESFSRTLATTSDAGTCWAVLTDVSRVAGWVTIVGEVNEIEPLAKILHGADGQGRPVQAEG